MGRFTGPFPTSEYPADKNLRASIGIWKDVEGMGLNEISLNEIDLNKMAGDRANFLEGAVPRQGEVITRNEGEIRILVTDDSPDNRALLKAYLSKTPYELVFAEDGKEAVEAFMAGGVDLILMDLHMPVMDGLMATAAIRSLERETGRPRTPVVAITASLLPEDRVRSGKAGCDLHLSKPISKAILLEAIQPYLEARRAQQAPAESIPISMPAGLEALVPSYLAARKKDVQELSALVAAADFARIRTLAHNMKGTAQPYGFSDLMPMAAALEECARNGDGPAAANQVARIADYIHRVVLVP